VTFAESGRRTCVFNATPKSLTLKVASAAANAVAGISVRRSGDQQHDTADGTQSWGSNGSITTGHASHRQ